MDDPNALQVVQLTDMHLRATRGAELKGVDTEATLHAVLARIAAESQPDLYLLTGDLAEDPAPATYARLRDIMGNTGVPAWCLPGNHDDPEIMRAELNRDGLATPRARRVNGWLIVLLDSSMPGRVDGELGTGELAILADILASYPDEPTLVALHHPPVALGSKWIDALGLADAGTFFEVIDANPQVRAVIWGHAHQAWEGRWEDTLLLGTPSTCMQFRTGTDAFELDDKPPAWRRLTLHPDGRVETELGWLAPPEQGEPEQ